ncbi:MAG: tetraacyldisaccharide 4'-kinase [Bacteroidota bacterium]
MVQKIVAQILLAPFALLYGLSISLRNFFYSNGVLKEIEFNLPVISVGNLSVGGAGKTPHIEYLIRLLQDHLEVATLSRGYKRKTKGYLEAQVNHTANAVGDEPLQFKRKYPNITVTVSESRSFGIPEIVKRHPDTQVILLDDAFQHRAVKPGLNILLTEYGQPFTEDYLLPAGRLREWRSAYKRADAIIVSKCPRDLSEVDRKHFEEQIKPLPHQQLYYSFYHYLKPYYLFNGSYQLNLEPDVDILLVSAIASTDYLLQHVETLGGQVNSLEFEDHHDFTNRDIARMKTYFDRLESTKKVIITTEKDAMRMQQHRDYLLEHKLPVFVLPVEVQFHGGDQAAFNQEVQNYLLNFKV